MANTGPAQELVALRRDTASLLGVSPGDGELAGAGDTAVQQRAVVAQVMADAASVPVAKLPVMLVDAVLGMAQRSAVGDPVAKDPVLAYWLAERDEVHLVEVFAEHAEPDDDIVHVLAAQSFAAFLLARGGAQQFVRLIAACADADVLTAVASVYGSAATELEAEWYAGASLDPVDKPTMWGVAKRTASYWKPHKKIAVVLLIMLGIQQAFTTAYALGMKSIIDNLLAHTNDPPLSLVLGGLAIAFMAAAVASLYGERLTATISVKIINGLRQRMFNHLMRLASDFYGRTNTGDILSRFSSDLETLKKSLTKRVVTTLLALVGLVINLPMLFLLEWRLALVVCVTLPLMILIVGRFAPAASEAGYELKTAEANMINTVQETVRAQAVVRGFHLESRMEDGYQQQLDNLADKTVRADFLSALVGTVPSLGVLLIQLGVTALGAWMAFNGHMSAGALVAFITLLGAVSKDTYALSKKALPALIKASSGVRRIEELMNELPSVVEARDPKKLPRLDTDIRLRDVMFSYTGEATNLRGVSLTVPAHSYAAFVGPSGSGKSTILNLVTRFYDPSRGSVAFDGTDLRKASLASLRGQLGIVFQESFLFNTTIRENIRLANKSATDAEVEAAAKSAAIYEVIVKLPQGFDTMVGEAGGRLSGGQRQRIAIARAMLPDPAVLVLDEATSALDPGTEAELNATIMELAKGRTVVAVTHRLASITGVQCIFVMKDGELSEQGTHDELLQRDGVYAELWNKQSGFDVTDDGRHAQIKGERLKQLNLFRDVDDAELLDSLAERFRSEYFDTDHVIIEEGARVDRFYVLVRGRVELVRHSYVRREQQLAVLEDGDSFGILPLVRDEPSGTTVRALAGSLCLTLSRDEFLTMVAESPEVAAAAGQVKKQRYLEELFGERPKSARPSPASEQEPHELIGL